MKGWHWIALDLEDRENVVYVDQGLRAIESKLRKHQDFELYIRHLANQADAEARGRDIPA